MCVTILNNYSILLLQLIKVHSIIKPLLQYHVCYHKYRQSEWKYMYIQVGCALLVWRRHPFATRKGLVVLQYQSCTGGMQFMVLGGGSLLV